MTVDTDTITADRPSPAASSVPVVRRPRFHFDDVPDHWVVGHPLVTHVTDVFNILLPPGERWFCRTFREALPQVHDETLREQVKAFIGQEAIHGRSHSGFVDKRIGEGWPVGGIVDSLEDLFAEDPSVPVPLADRLWIIANVEVYTAMLAGYIFETDAVDDAHPVMRDLLLWHLAEEVEHKSVAHDLATALDPSYGLRVRTAVLVAVLLSTQVARILVALIRADPELTWRRTAVEVWRERRHLLQLARRSAGCFLRSLQRGDHPSQEPDPVGALAYLHDSPAMIAAASAGERASEHISS